MTRTSSVAVLLLAMLACTPVAENGDPEPADPQGEESARALQVELVEADRAFASSVAKNRLSGWISGFAANGRMVAGGQPHVGAEGIRRVMLAPFADTSFHLTWDPTFAAVSSSGDLGYTVGTYESARRVNGDRVVDRGTYLTVWRRQADGAWKVEADIGNPAPAGDAPAN